AHGQIEKPFCGVLVPGENEVQISFDEADARHSPAACEALQKGIQPLAVVVRHASPVRPLTGPVALTAPLWYSCPPDHHPAKNSQSHNNEEERPMVPIAGRRVSASRACLAALLAACISLACPLAVRAADPIKVGFSMALTGGVAVNGKQILLTLEIWRDDINAKGGLLGRPLQLVYYDDQSNPANVPGIYSKLIDVDKVDLLIGPYATNMIASAMPIIMQNNRTTI